MAKRKLIALAAVAGILACGACFLPPPRRPPPPPLRIDLGGIQEIRVEVTNASATHHIDPAELSQWIAESINLQRRGEAPQARSGGEARESDAVLRVSIVDESVTADSPSQTASTAAEVQLTLNSTLTRPDGAVAWQETKHPYRSPPGFRLAASSDPWASTSVAAWAHYFVCRRLVMRMFTGEP